MSTLHETGRRLGGAHTLLVQRWEDARTLWRDPVAWHFEKQYWNPLHAQARATQQELERLAQVIAQAQRQVR